MPQRTFNKDPSPSGLPGRQAVVAQGVLTRVNLRRWVLRFGGAVVLLGGVAAVQAVRAARSEASLFYPPRGSVGLPAILFPTPIRDVTVPYGNGDQIRVWYIAPRNRATVILAHGSGTNRSQLATETRRLADAGFGVLAFDWPGHGESSGRVTYGLQEKDSFNAAVSFAAAQPEADPGRIGALGFSVGAALVALAAAGDTRIRAVVLVSTFADSDEETRYEFARWGPLMQWPALWVDRTFMPDGPLRPVDSVRALAGRSLLIVAASDDPVVPSWMSEKVYAAARARKEFLILPHSGHSGFDALAPGLYGDSILGFFRDALGATISP